MAEQNGQLDIHHTESKSHDLRSEEVFDAQTEEAVRELAELKAMLPPPDRSELFADWAWFDKELGKGPSGALLNYAGRYVAVYQKQVIDSGSNPLCLRAKAARGKTSPIHPEQIVISFVEPWDFTEE